MHKQMHNYDLNQSIIFHNVIIVIVSINRFDIKMQSSVVQCSALTNTPVIINKTVFTRDEISNLLSFSLRLVDCKGSIEPVFIVVMSVCQSHSFFFFHLTFEF